MHWRRSSSSASTVDAARYHRATSGSRSQVSTRPKSAALIRRSVSTPPILHHGAVCNGTCAGGEACPEVGGGKRHGAGPAQQLEAVMALPVLPSQIVNSRTISGARPASALDPGGGGPGGGSGGGGGGGGAGGER